MKLDWFGPIVAGVIRSRLDTLDRDHLVAAAPPGPEMDLLGRILEGWLPGVLLVPLSPEEVQNAASALEVPPPPEATPGPASWEGAALLKAAGSRGLAVSLANRTTLLLSGPLPLLPLAPLGDVPASVVAATVGGCTLPGPLQPLAGDPAALAALDEALTRWARGAPASKAVRELDLPGDLVEEIELRLAQGPARRGPACVVPKLADPTPGIDLDA